MNPVRRRLAAALMALAAPALLLAQARPRAAALPMLGRAPGFALTDQTGAALDLLALRGKVVVVTFVFTTCAGSCPTLTAKLVDVRQRLGRQHAAEVHFVAISVDPLNDTPPQLRRYAASFGVDGPGWSFLTGRPTRVEAVVSAYGAFAARAAHGQIEHLFLTSLVDRRGELRLQYLGTQFDPREMAVDLLSLVHEP